MIGHIPRKGQDEKSVQPHPRHPPCPLLPAPGHEFGELAATADSLAAEKEEAARIKAFAATVAVEITQLKQQMVEAGYDSVTTTQLANRLMSFLGRLSTEKNRLAGMGSDTTVTWRGWSPEVAKRYTDGLRVRLGIGIVCPEGVPPGEYSKQLRQAGFLPKE